MPLIDKGRRGVTFPVDDVTPAAKPLEEWKTHRAVERLVGGPVESCCDYSGDVVHDVNYQPLLAAVFLAHSQHRPLVLGPDAVWLTIAQGVAHHMTIHAERLRPRLVAHAGRLTLRVDVRDWVPGSPENPWTEAFAGWAAQIRDHVGPVAYDALVCDFSTTGPVERAASHVVLMDVFERYFHYELMAICGIPAISIEGTPADWERLRDKVRRLEMFDLQWWIEHLLPLCDHFVRAARGDVDVGHWQRICKLRESYGGDIISGWIARLFPYLRAWPGGPVRRRNPVFETGEGFQPFFAPLGLSRVPFTWTRIDTGDRRDMEAFGGLVGITQDRGTLALRPKVGWAVAPIGGLDALLGRVERDHVTRPGVAGLTNIERANAVRRGWDEPPEDLASFYHRTNGAELFRAAAGGPGRYLILPLEQLSRLTHGDGPAWHRLAAAADGSSFAIDLRGAHDEQFRRINHVCRYESDWRSSARNAKVVATSFTELLARMLDGGDRFFWA